MNSRVIHEFDNGVKVYEDQLLATQKERYAKRNVHEAEEEDLFIKLIQTLPVSACYVNVGSAIGYYVLLAKLLSPELTIHAVEPLGRHLNFFRENIELNGFREEDFHIHTIGIGRLKGEMLFVDRGYASRLVYTNGKGLGTFFRHLFQRPDDKSIPQNDESTVKINTITLDHLSESISKPIDLLQMDVQCLEADVLLSGKNALQNGLIKTFLIGTHRTYIHEECIRILNRFDYVIERDEYDTKEQPDGILLASKGIRRL